MATELKGARLRTVARRLLPVIAAFVLAACLILTGVFKQSRPELPASPGRVAHHAATGLLTSKAAGVSSNVGGIPGVQPGAHPWRVSPHQTASTAVIAAKPLPLQPGAKKDAARKNAARKDSGTTAGRLRKLLPADVLVVAPASLPSHLAARIRAMAGVVAAVPVDAGRVQVNGVYVNVLGVKPAAFRPFAARPTADSSLLWHNIAAGGMAISYTMGREDRLTLDKPVHVTGTRAVNVPVAGFGTVGVGGVDAVVSDRVAKSVGLPSANAIVVSAPKARLDRLLAKIRKIVPGKTAVTALVTQVIVSGSTVTTGAAGGLGVTASDGPGMTATEVARFLAAAKSRLGMPYVWGDNGPDAFDCSGLVQWSMAQAGLVMPRVAADQAMTGPLIPLSELEPGDLLFYHTDPTAPDYISHVAIYIGNGLMEQAPEPGMDVQVVRAIFGAGFAGAVQVYPRLAAKVAAEAG
jgi:peptidoglycan DL-endopeptidase CwlO